MTDAGDSKKLSRERYGRFAESYVESRSHAKGWDLDRLIEIVAPRADQTVLDVATGGGHTALKMAPHVRRVVATDLTPEMLVAARTFVEEQGATNVEFQPADAENLPFEAGEFDLVTCRIAAHHFPDAGRFVGEVARVLKPGGLFWLQDHVLSEDPATADYADGFEKLRDPSHNKAYSERQWREMIEASGLQVEHAEQIVKRHPFDSWTRRQQCSPEVVRELTRRLEQAPSAAREWMQPLGLGTDELSFVNHHLLISGRRPSY